MRPFETSLFPRVHWTWGRIHRRDWWWTSSHNIRWGGDNAYHQQKEDTNIFLQKLWKRKKSFAPLSFFFCTLDARQCIITRVHNNSKDFSRKKKAIWWPRNLSIYLSIQLSLSLSHCLSLLLFPLPSPKQPMIFWACWRLATETGRSTRLTPTLHPRGHMPSFRSVVHELVNWAVVHPTARFVVQSDYKTHNDTCMATLSFTCPWCDFLVVYVCSKP